MINFKFVILHKPFLFFYFLVLPASLWSQIFPVKDYPKGYFIYPVVAKIGLAANFGELRPNHYHMGLDCRTDQKQNAHVLAAADGYIAHVRIEPSGFGRAIYINHPNGLTTVYGHLNNFFPELEDYVKKQQYKIQSWEVFLDIPKNLFLVKKGQFIAFSGNAGASQGPHLHFEIRDTKTDRVLNPLLFGFPIPDNLPPSLYRLAIYDRRVSTYSQIPRLYPLKKIGSNYAPSPAQIVVGSDRVSFGISAVDRLSGSSNPNGIYEAVLYNDGLGIVGFQLDSISYDETRYLNAHIDYKLRASGGPFVEHLSRLPGYPPGVYKDINGDGVIELKDGNTHQIKVTVRDTYGNVSVLQFSLRRGTLIGEPYKDSTAEGVQRFIPNYINVFERSDIQVILGENELYDSVNFNYSKKASQTPGSASDLHIVHSGLVPVNGFFTIRIKANKPLENSGADKIIIQRTWGGKTDVVKPKREGDWFTGKFKNFGNFQLLVDDLPPKIVPIGIRENANLSRASQIIFSVTDNLKAIKNFRATLDGRWLRFSNDKGKNFIYKFDEMCLPGNHELIVTVEDEAGNQTSKNYHFIR